jgi:hypothetical protein
LREQIEEFVKKTDNEVMVTIEDGDVYLKE